MAAAIRAAEAILTARGYAGAERAIEVIHVALEDSLDETADNDGELAPKPVE